MNDNLPSTADAWTVHFGRKVTKHVRTLFDRCWLQAKVRRIAIYVRLTFSSGNSDAEFPLLEVLRTKPGVPRPAAMDPKQTYAPEPFLTAYRP